MKDTIAAMPETITADEDLDLAYVEAMDMDTMKKLRLVYRLELVAVEDEQGNEVKFD